MTPVEGQQESRLLQASSLRTVAGSLLMCPIGNHSFTHSFIHSPVNTCRAPPVNLVHLCHHAFSKHMLCQSAHLFGGGVEGSSAGVSRVTSYPPLSSSNRHSYWRLLWHGEMSPRVRQRWPVTFLLEPWFPLLLDGQLCRRKEMTVQNMPHTVLDIQSEVNKCCPFLDCWGCWEDAVSNVTCKMIMTEFAHWKAYGCRWKSGLQFPFLKSWVRLEYPSILAPLACPGSGYQGER